MSQQGKNSFSGLLKTPGMITPEDVRYMRREVFRDGIVSTAEAEAVFAMNDQVADKCAGWNEFFAEALCDYTVAQAEPRGYVSLANAEWLIARISHDGHVEQANELELLIRVMNKARRSPEKLAAFALGEVARAVVEGLGPLCCDRELTPGTIGEAEVEMLRAALYAFGGEAGISISRAEAEILFDLNEKTAEADNHPAWRELFVKAIGNYLMAASSYRAIPRAQALAREEWLADTGTDTAGFLKQAFSGFGSLFSEGFFSEVTNAHEQMQQAWAKRNAAQAAAAQSAARIDHDEAEWLIDRLVSDGIIDDREKDLLEFIRSEAGPVAPVLEPWMQSDKVAS